MEKGVILFSELFHIFSINFISIFQSPFFEAGEGGGGFNSQEFRSPGGAVDFPACFVQRGFDVRLFPQANVIFGQNLTGIAAVFLDGRFE